MTIHQNTAESQSRKRDPDFIGADAALKRAALRARKKALSTGTRIVVVRNGKVVEEHPID